MNVIFDVKKDICKSSQSAIRGWKPFVLADENWGSLAIRLVLGLKLSCKKENNREIERFPLLCYNCTTKGGDGMAKTTTVQARIDPILKQDAEKVLAAIGLNSTTAINMFYSQIKLRQGLPFDARIPNAETREAMSEAKSGKKLKKYDTAQAMFEDLDG